MSNTAGNPDKKNDVLDEDLRVMAVADAVGALSERDQQKLEYLETVAEPSERKALWDAREGVMKQMRDDLPEVEPESSLKHRVLARVLSAVESDLVQSTEGGEAPLQMAAAVVKRGWVERFVGGGVTPIWRVAALVLITVSVGLFWVSMAANNTNNELRRLARDGEFDRFSEKIGPRSADLLINPDAERIAFRPVETDKGARGVLSYLPIAADSGATQRMVFFANKLPVDSEREYYICVNAPSVKNIVISFKSDGQVVSVDFDLPPGVDPRTAAWFVIVSDEKDSVIEVMQSIS